jgi:RNA polymerase sigma factor (sigma-70 family)
VIPAAFAMPNANPTWSRPEAEDDDVQLDKNGGSFPMTQWSVVLRAGLNTDTQAHAALEALCARYWYPLYTYIRRKGRDHHEAEDCTQEFLARLLAGNSLKQAQPERGRFRNFLLTSLRNFLISEWRHSQTAKRGGGVTPVPLSPPNPDEKYCNEPHDPALTPEQAFDRSWALSMIDQSVCELRAEYQRSGRAAVFDAVAPLIWGNSVSESVEQQAARVNLTIQAFTVALHRARRRLGQRLRINVAATVADAAEIDTELRHLISAVEMNGRGG